MHTINKNWASSSRGNVSRGWYYSKINAWRGNTTIVTSAPLPQEALGHLRSVFEVLIVLLKMLFKLLDFTRTGWADAFPKQGVHHCWIHDLPARTRCPRLRGHREAVAAVLDQDAARWLPALEAVGLKGHTSMEGLAQGSPLTHTLISDFKQRQVIHRPQAGLVHMAELHQSGFGHLSRSRKALATEVPFSPLTTPLYSGRHMSVLGTAQTPLDQTSWNILSLAAAFLDT